MSTKFHSESAGAAPGVNVEKSVSAAGCHSLGPLGIGSFVGAFRSPHFLARTLDK